MKNCAWVLPCAMAGCPTGPYVVSMATGSFLRFTLSAGLGAFMELRNHATSPEIILPNLVVA